MKMARIKPQALLQQSKKKKGPVVTVYTLVVIVLGFFLFVSYKHWSWRSSVTSEEKLSSVEHTSYSGNSKKVDIPKYAEIKTSKGSITVELFKDSSPEVVDEFIGSWYALRSMYNTEDMMNYLCYEKGHFKGMLFTRVIKHFVIQGGDVTSLGTTQDWIQKGKQYNQLDKSLKHEAFMMGTSKHNGKGFNLVITTAPIPDLSKQINVFGRVVKGEDVVQEIEEVDTDQHYQPKTPIKITEVTFTRKP